MQINPVQHRVLETCFYLVLFLSFLFHNTGDVAFLSADTYAKITALDAYHTALAVAQLVVDCVSIGLDWTIESGTWLLESLWIIEALPIPDDVSIPRKTFYKPFDHWEKTFVNRPIPSRACAPLNRGTNRPALSPPTSPHRADEKVTAKPLPTTLSKDIDTSSPVWQPRKAEYWCALWSAQVSAPAPKKRFRGSSGLEVEATVAPSKQSRAIPRVNVDRIDRATIEQPDTGAQDAGEASAPQDLGAKVERPKRCVRDAGERSTPHESGAPLPTQVGGKPRKKGLFGKLRVKVAATVASAKRSRAIVKANVDRITNAAKLKLGRRKTVKFFPMVQVQEADSSIWDEEARWKYVSKARERRIEAAYWLWGRGREASEIPRSVFDTTEEEEDEDDKNDEDDEDDEESGEDVDEESLPKSEREEAMEESVLYEPLPTPTPRIWLGPNSIGT